MHVVRVPQVAAIINVIIPDVELNFFYFGIEAVQAGTVFKCVAARFGLNGHVGKRRTLGKCVAVLLAYVESKVAHANMGEQAVGLAEAAVTKWTSQTWILCEQLVVLVVFGVLLGVYMIHRVELVQHMLRQAAVQTPSARFKRFVLLLLQELSTACLPLLLAA